MKLRIEDFKFSDGKSIQVSQENWDISMALSEMQRQAKAEPLEDDRLQYFRENIYPVLAACSVGSFPSLEETYGILESKPADVDRWYRLVQDVNPLWFQFHFHNEDQTVEFSDGTKLIVHDANVPSVIMKLRDLETFASENPLPEMHKQVFRMTFYARFAACSSGQVPTEEEARNWPSPETNKWYEAVKTVNPHFYDGMEKMAGGPATQEDIKKKRKRHGR